VISPEQILEAEARIRKQVRETPVDYSFALSALSGCNVFFKLEHLQHTGSFKLRGAMNKILSLNEDELRRGVIAASTGNHGMGVCWAARAAGAKATIYLPREASESKLSMIRHLGGQAVPEFADCLAAEVQARRDADEMGKTFVSPYNDEHVIAGQGTIGIELARKIDQFDAVFIAVGGGGLIGGIAAYLKSARPGIKIVGCWPEYSPVMLECLRAGRIIEVPEQPTLSESTAGGVEENSLTFPLCRDLIDEYAVVTEAEIAAAMRLVFEKERWVIEGAAGMAVAAMLKEKERFKKRNVAVVLCGRNISASRWMEAVSQ
jgi:threonine dehydratase